MNYIWELMLEADKAGVLREKLRFQEAQNPSPYLEVSFEDLNQTSIEESMVEVNPLYRFASVFCEICDSNVVYIEDLRNCFLDICMHYFAQLDLRQGVSRQDYYIHFLTEELKKDIFGAETGNCMKLFDKEEIKKWMIPFVQLYKTQNYRYEFTRAVCSLYPNAYVYESNDLAYEFLLYLGVMENEREQKRIQFLIDAFLPVQYTIHIFYEHHFGIIGMNETMVIDEMAIF